MLADKCLYYLKEAQPYITPELYDELYEMLARLQLVTIIRRMHAEAYFGLRMLEGEYSLPGLKERIGRAINGLYMLEDLTRLNKRKVKDTIDAQQLPAEPWKIRKIAGELAKKLNQLN